MLLALMENGVDEEGTKGSGHLVTRMLARTLEAQQSVGHLSEPPTNDEPVVYRGYGDVHRIERGWKAMVDSGGKMMKRGQPQRYRRSSEV